MEVDPPAHAAQAAHDEERTANDGQGFSPAGSVSRAALVPVVGDVGIGTASDPAPNLVRFPDGVAGWSMGSGGVASALSQVGLVLRLIATSCMAIMWRDKPLRPTDRLL